MSKIFRPFLLLLLAFTIGCARYQNPVMPQFSSLEFSQHYRIGKIESKHGKEIESFVQKNYFGLITDIAEAPIINIYFIDLDIQKPRSGAENILHAFTFGFIPRKFSAHKRCVVQVIKENQIINESTADEIGIVESWGYFALLKELDENWAILPADLEAEKKAFTSAIGKIIALNNNTATRWTR